MRGHSERFGADRMRTIVKVRAISAGASATTHRGSDRDGRSSAVRLRFDTRLLHRGAGVATVPRVRIGAPWRYTTMPANLPPQYLKAEDEYRKAQSAEVRLEKLREMFRLLPKHKATEKLRTYLKR